MEQNQTPINSGEQFAAVYKIASAIMIVALIVIGAAVFPFSFESDGRYLISSPVVIALYIAVGITVAFALSAFSVLKDLVVAPSVAVANRVTAALSAAAMAVPFIYYIYSDVNARISAFSAAPEAPTASYSGLDTVSVIITVIAAVSLICSLYLTVRESKIASLTAGYARAALLALIITKLYLDFSVELNSPVKILVQFAAVAAMLATVAKLRPIVGKTGASTFALTQFLSAALCLLCFTLFITEIAPNSAKYTADLFAFPIMLLVLGTESIALLFTCRITSPAVAEEASVTAPAEGGEAADEQSADETDGTAGEAVQEQAEALPENTEANEPDECADASDQ